MHILVDVSRSRRSSSSMQCVHIGMHSPMVHQMQSDHCSWVTAKHEDLNLLVWDAYTWSGL